MKPIGVGVIGASPPPNGNLQASAETSEREDT